MENKELMEVENSSCRAIAKKLHRWGDGILADFELYLYFSAGRSNLSVVDDLDYCTGLTYYRPVTTLAILSFAWSLTRKM